MSATVENVLAIVAILPAVYGIACWVRRQINAQRTAKWVRETHNDAWNALPWLARRNPWAGVETLIAKGLISGSIVDEFRLRDNYLEKATWIGLLVSALLLLAIFLLKSLANI
jgi:hypothetical protein